MSHLRTYCGPRVKKVCPASDAIGWTSLQVILTSRNIETCLMMECSFWPPCWNYGWRLEPDQPDQPDPPDYRPVVVVLSLLLSSRTFLSTCFHNCQKCHCVSAFRLNTQKESTFLLLPATFFFFLHGKIFTFRQWPEFPYGRFAGG